MSIDAQPCWICGGGPLTNEHLLKRSDLKRDFGPAIGERPLYLHIARRQLQKDYRAVRVQGYGSKELCARVICGRCNDTLTQPYDFAWDKFSEYLRFVLSNSPEVSRVRGDKAFCYQPESYMVNMHLFFAKNLGCLLRSAGVHFDFEGLAKSILEQSINPYLYLTFGIFQHPATGISTLHVLNDSSKNNEVVAAIYFYETGGFAVRVQYSIGEINQRDLWNPKYGKTRLSIVRFGEIHQDIEA